MFTYGVLFTLLYFFILGITVLGLDLDPVSSWNELGDFLAGAFSPVAFFWLVLGYLQQQRELQQNTQALMLQAKELKESVEQASQMVTLTRQQLDFEVEKNALQREVFRYENAPKLFLSLGPSSTRVKDERISELLLKNYGKAAAELKLFVNNRVTDFHSPVLGNDQALPLRIGFSMKSLPRKDVVTIKCYNVHNEEYSFEFDVHISADETLRVTPKSKIL